MKFLRATVAILVLVAFDQYTKYMVVEHFAMHEYYPIAGDLFGLYYLQNEGMSWGMFQGKQIVFLIFTIIVLVAVGYIYIKLLQDVFFRPLNVCMLFLSSGAIGNMIDRMIGVDYLHSGNVADIQFLHGGVVDFLYIKMINFPVFNVADMYVTISIAVIVILLFTKYRNIELDTFLGRSKRQEKADGNDPLSNPSAEMTKDTTDSVRNENDNRDLSQENDPEQTQDAVSRSPHLHHIFSNEEEEDD